MHNSFEGYCCGICNQRYHHPSLIYSCNYGHFFCRACYKHEYSEGKGPLCPYRYCNAHIYRVDKQVLPCKSNEQNKGKKMFPDITFTTAVDAKNSSLSVEEEANYKLALLSKRPVNCPYPGCKKAIAVTAFDSHFKYEHKSVAFIRTSYNTRNALEFNPYDVKNQQKMCIVLIHVANKVHCNLPCGDTNKETSTKIEAAKLIMLVMASGIPTHKRGNSFVDDEEDSDELESFSFFPYEKIIFWVSSNILSKSKYTIAVSTICKQIRFKYYGPVSQVNDNCIHLCDEGKGLILNHRQLTLMTDNGQKPLSLDIVLHNDN